MAARALADVDTRAEAAFKADTPTSERTGALAPAPAVPQAVVTTNATAEERRLRRARGEVLEAGVEQARAEQQVAAIAGDSVSLVTSLRSKAESWTEVNEATAQAFLAGPVAVVEDFPVVTYATRVADGRRAVRVRQDLGSAGLLELVQETLGGFALAEAQERNRERAADDPLPVAADRLRAADEIESVERKDSLTTVSVRRGNYLITIRAPISMDSLRALLKRIR